MSCRNVKAPVGSTLMAPTSRFNLGSTTISSWNPPLHTRNTLRSRLIEKVHCVECLRIVNANHPLISHQKGSGRLQSYHQLVPAVDFVEFWDNWRPSLTFDTQGITTKEKPTGGPKRLCPLISLNSCPNSNITKNFASHSSSLHPVGSRTSRYPMRVLYR